MKIKILIPILLTIFIIAVIFNVNTVSASTSAIYVDLNGSDNWSGENPIWNGTDGPKKTIKKAIETVSADGTIYINNGTYNEHGLVINKNLNIQGGSKENTIIDGQSIDRIFTIQTGIRAQISGLTIKNGRTAYSGGAIYSKGYLTANNVLFVNNKALSNYGGAVCSVYYSLSLTNCTLSGNQAKVGGGISGTFTSIKINQCSFSYNRANDGAGGSIVNSRGSLSVNKSRFISNTAVNGFGGAFYNRDGALTIGNCYFTLNNAPEGGAVYTENIKGNVYVTNNTFIKNTANKGRAGALYHCNGTIISNNNIFTNNRAIINGGAIYIDSTGLPSKSYSTIVTNNCIFTNNTANQYGGAIYVDGTLKASNCSFITNKAIGVSGGAICNAKGILVLTNNNFKGNKAVKGGAVYSHYGKITITKNSFISNSGKYTKYKGLYLYLTKGTVSGNRFI